MSNHRQPIVRSAAAIAVALLCSTAHAAVTVSDLTCEHAPNPIGIGADHPRFSWILQADRRGDAQTAYEIRAAASPASLQSGKPDLWDSGKIVSDNSVLIPWGGKPLNSRAEVFWQVRAWDTAGDASPWSGIARLELGLLHPDAEWKARWIANDAPRYTGPGSGASDILHAQWIWAPDASAKRAAFRKEIELPDGANVRDAQCDISSTGGFVLYVNGRRARERSDRSRADAWKKLTHGYLLPQMKPGKNVFTLTATAGAGNDGTPGLVGEIALELDNGQKIHLLTDNSWKATATPGSDVAQAKTDDSSWGNAATLGAFAEGRWSAISDEETIGPGRYFRKSFSLHGPIAKARLYAAALGVYEARINGKPVGDQQLAPGWTEYSQRVMVQTYDVTPLLQQGDNACSVLLGDGWYAGRVGWMGLSQYGKTPAFAAQLEITFADGHVETLPTDTSWKTGGGAVRGADQQWGEVIDDREATPCDQPAFDDSHWTAATIANVHPGTLVPQVGPPVRRLMEVAPKSIHRRRNSWIVDFGQNLVGHVRLTAKGPARTQISVQHAEILNPDGSLYTANLRVARNRDTFILSGQGEEQFNPTMTVHGFRYAQVDGYPGILSPEDIHAEVIGSDTPPTGTFECSDPRVNRLCQNIEWGQRGNFLSVPTDCPQRDERMGWMGDAQVFCRTAAWNANVAGFFTKWLRDVDDAQGNNGNYSNFSPRAESPQQGVPGWADAGVIIPWTMYRVYGDTAFLADHYDSMVKFLGYLQSHANDNLQPNRGIGDHLNPGTFIPLNVVSTAFYAHDVDLVARAADRLGKRDDAKRFHQLFTQIARAYDDAFISADGTIKGDTQSGYLFTLRFGLAPQEMRPTIAAKLAENVQRVGHLTTGFLGVGYLCPVLSDTGRTDLAYKLLLNDNYPSWLFPIRYGATTIWERWDGWTPEKGFQDPSMNSFNHYSLGSVGQWLYSGVAGIQQLPGEEGVGFKQVRLRPGLTRALGDHGFARATYRSVQGEVACGWRLEGETAHVDVQVPLGVRGHVELPCDMRQVKEEGMPVHAGNGISGILQDGGNCTIIVGSGRYQFTFPSSRVK